MRVADRLASPVEDSEDTLLTLAWALANALKDSKGALVTLGSNVTVFTVDPIDVDDTDWLLNALNEFTGVTDANPDWDALLDTDSCELWETEGAADTDTNADWEALLETDSCELCETDGAADTDANADCVP
jgi:hypothetical protein